MANVFLAVEETLVLVVEAIEVLPDVIEGALAMHRDINPSGGILLLDRVLAPGSEIHEPSTTVEVDRLRDQGRASIDLSENGK